LTVQFLDDRGSGAGVESRAVRCQDIDEGLANGSWRLDEEALAASRASPTNWANVREEAMEFSALRTASRA
jgi:hypothetical protein